MSVVGGRWSVVSAASCMLVFIFSIAAGQEEKAARVSAEGWREAGPGYRYEFPRDHGSHPDYRIEWWYYTGNIETREGRLFGYQLTFFRTGVVREPALASRWAVRDLYMAHFAVSDIERKRLNYFERVNRAGIGWAGADDSTYRVWNEDWEARLDGGDHLIRASEGDIELDLRLTPAKPEVIHGRDGISQKGPSAGHSSHYYSITRFQTSGKLVLGGESFDVTGLSWMDHEFGTSFLERSQVGWDWFSIQLEDGRELMLFQIRREDGSRDPRSSATLIDTAGRATHIEFGEFDLAPLARWRSAASGAVYPTEWRIDLPGYDLRLAVRASFEDQELRAEESTGVTYWEGSVEVEGATGDKPLRGRGYLEMTGYSGQNMGAIIRLD
jgi:predicted secreted hydrolase